MKEQLVEEGPHPYNHQWHHYKDVRLCVPVTTFEISIHNVQIKFNTKLILGKAYFMVKSRSQNLYSGQLKNPLKYQIA